MNRQPQLDSAQLWHWAALLVVSVGLWGLVLLAAKAIGGANVVFVAAAIGIWLAFPRSDTDGA